MSLTPQPDNVEYLRREMQRARSRISGKHGYALTLAKQEHERARARWVQAVRKRVLDSKT